MKIEKLSENKIRVIFNYEDLSNNNIDIHSFMSNSVESQSIFLNILNEAERKVGFITDNYKLSIEALALSNNTFIITITKMEKEFNKSHRVHAQRNNFSNTISSKLIYKFSTYTDLICLKNFLKNYNSELFNKFIKSYLLYEYNNFLFLIIENIENKNIIDLTNIISEFAIQIEDTGIVFEKIREFGKIVDVDGL